LEAESASELKQLASKNQNLHLLQLDVDDYEGIKRVTSEVGDKLQGKGLNLLLNNAGIMNRQVIGDITPEEMMRVYKTNVVSPIMVIQGLLPLLKTAAQDPGDDSSPKAVIINVTTGYASSTFRHERVPYPYTASKTALNAMTRAMNVDLKSFGISVFACDPGWVQTDMGSGAGKAPSTAQQSVSGLIKAFGSFDENTKNGVPRYDGVLVPW
jgi:NAD(P)-dependent dehydrogenase (short-subunit alcohol dehydrogenase family)